MLAFLLPFRLRTPSSLFPTSSASRSPQDPPPRAFSPLSLRRTLSMFQNRPRYPHLKGQTRKMPIHRLRLPLLETRAPTREEPEMLPQHNPTPLLSRSPLPTFSTKYYLSSASTLPNIRHTPYSDSPNWCCIPSNTIATSCLISTRWIV